MRGTCRTPTRTHALAGNDLGFATRVRRELHTKHSSFIKPLTHTSAFGVKHFAGDVLYHTSGFCETVRFACVDACDAMRAMRVACALVAHAGPGRAASATVARMHAGVHASGRPSLRPHGTLRP